MTARLDSPSSLIKLSASAKGLSALFRTVSTVRTSCHEGKIPNSDDLLRSNGEIAHQSRVEIVYNPEVDAFIPEELDESQLAQDASNFASRVGHKDSMNATAENLDGPCEIFIRRQDNQCLFTTDELRRARSKRSAMLR